MRSSTTKWLLVVSLLLGDAGCRQATVRGKSFTIKIPAGYRIFDQAPLPPGAVALAQRQRAAEGYFLGSLVITPVAAAVETVKVDNVAFCQQVGTAMAQQAGATLGAAAVVDSPFGKTCQFDVRGARQAARGTVVKGPQDAWVLTCNHDPRDLAVLAACQQVLEGWKFD